MTASILGKMKVRAPQVKETVSLKLSKEVLAFYEGDDKKGYTSRMAAVLTAYAEAHQHK